MLYDERERLIESFTHTVEVDPTQTVLNHEFTTLINITGYNALHQAVSQIRKTIDLDKTTTETTIAPVEYDDQGRITRIFNSVEIEGLGANYDYTTDVSITKYSTTGLALRQTRITQDLDKTTIETSLADMLYDERERLIESFTHTVEVDPTATLLNHEFTTLVNITSYNALHQAVSQEFVVFVVVI